MKASIVDLRYKMKEILKALDKNETVTVFHRGILKGTLIPAKTEKKKKIEDHPFFGMTADNIKKSVLEELDDLRKPRHNDL